MDRSLGINGDRDLRLSDDYHLRYSRIRFGFRYRTRYRY